MIKIKCLSILSLFFFLFFSAEGFSQKVDDKVNAVDKDGKRHGNWKKYYKNGRLRYTGNFIHGKEVGVFMYFDMTNSDQPTIIKVFSENSNIAKVEHQTTKGVLKSMGNMDGRNRVGKWKYFFPSGKVLSEENYVNGKLDGLLVNYYTNGKITEETYYKNGLKNGISKKYTDEGNLLEEVNYTANKPHGIAKFYDLKGNLKETGNYKNGKREGRWEFFVDGEAVSKKDKHNRKTHSIPKQ